MQIASIIGSGINGNPFRNPPFLSVIIASLLLLEVELMETYSCGKGIPSLIEIASIIGSGINGNSICIAHVSSRRFIHYPSLLLLEVELMETELLPSSSSSSKAPFESLLLLEVELMETVTNAIILQ